MDYFATQMVYPCLLKGIGLKSSSTGLASGSVFSLQAGSILLQVPVINLTNEVNKNDLFTHNT